MAAAVERVKAHFPSGADECAAWHYPGTNGACVIMAGGFAMTKEPATDRFAAEFHAAGYSVLAFDYRCLGESGGTPRQVVRVADQLQDWDAAIAAAARLPEVRPDKLVVWAFSVSGGHIFPVAARHPELAAAIAMTPNADGRAATRNALRYTTPSALIRLTARVLRDKVRGLFGREPLLVPLAGQPGEVALLTTPDALGGDQAFEDTNWVQAVAARSALVPGSYRPGRQAANVQCPLLVIPCQDDRSALAEPAVRAAGRAPAGEVVVLPGGHYAPFLEGHDAALAASLDFLRRHVAVSAGTAS